MFRFTKNTLKFRGARAEKNAQRFINRQWDRHGEWWEFVENCSNHSIIMRRRCRE